MKSNPATHSVSIIKDLILANQLKLQPAWQRRDVYTHAEKSSVLESMMLEYAIPPIYVSYDTTTRLQVVIDGQQRLSSIRDFYDIVKGNKHSGFALLLTRSLWVDANRLADYNALQGKTFENLCAQVVLQGATPPVAGKTSALAARILVESAKLSFCEILDPTSKQIRTTFEKLNVSSKKLNSDEVRNCLSDGRCMELVRVLADYPPFKSCFDEKQLQRMIDTGYVIRFLDAYEAHFTTTRFKDSSVGKRQTLKNSKPSERKMNMSVGNYNKFVDWWNKEDNITDTTWAEKALEWTALFQKAVDLCLDIFKERPFQLGKNLGVNTAVFDLLMLGVVDYGASKLENKDKTTIREKYDTMIQDTTNPFHQKLLGRPKEMKNESEARWLRNTEWFETILGVFGSNVVPKRVLSAKEKAVVIAQASNPKGQLVCQNPECGDVLRTRKDGEVDHIKPWATGGDTTIENSQFLCIPCNRKKGARENDLVSILEPA